MFVYNILNNFSYTHFFINFIYLIILYNVGLLNSYHFDYILLKMLRFQLVSKCTVHNDAKC